MAELAQSGMCSPWYAAAAANTTTKSVQAWRALVNCVAILLRLLLQILRGTPSWAQILSFVGLRHTLLFAPSASCPGYKPLAIDPPIDGPTPDTAPASEPLGKLTGYLFGVMFLKDADGRQKVNHVTVFERPGLREFLKQSSEFADLVLFTAGLEGCCHLPMISYSVISSCLSMFCLFVHKSFFVLSSVSGYASPVIDRIDVDNKLTHRLYRPATVST
ncbi:hypothetical protein GW17_00020476 [Ensete ventricosum]|nr:hypothetical protein GW17_00020476 [Ensete ventricosum]